MTEKLKTGSSDIEEIWNFKGCQNCSENHRKGHIVNKPCQVMYKGSCIVKQFNDIIYATKSNFYGHHYDLVSILMKEYPTLTFCMLKQGWSEFYIKELGCEFSFSKDVYLCDVINYAKKD